MRSLFTWTSFGALALLLSACHGGASSVVPQTASAPLTANQHAAGNASPAATRYWLSSCNGCGIRQPETTALINVYSASGTLLKQFTFDNNALNEGTPLELTSPDQKHVYANIDRFHENYIVDIDTATYAIRYYRLPVSDQQSVTGLFNNADGSRLYAVTTGGTYAINTVTRTYAGSYSGVLNFPAISANAQTLFGTQSGEMTAVTLSNFGQRHFARDAGTYGLAASTFYLYAGTSNGIRVYDLNSYAYLKTIVPGLYEQLVTDPAQERLYALNNGPTEEDLNVIDTQTNQLITTLPKFPGQPFLDPATHSIYAIDQTGMLCEYPMPYYTQTCLFSTNSPSYQYLVVTH